MDGAKVMRAIVTAAVKRRMPQLIERAIKRHREEQTGGEAGGKRKRETGGSDQKGKRLALRSGPPAVEHV